MKQTHKKKTRTKLMRPHVLRNYAGPRGQIESEANVGKHKMATSMRKEYCCVPLCRSDGRRDLGVQYQTLDIYVHIKNIKFSDRLLQV